MTDFYNPYQFIPVTGRIDGQPSARLPYTDIGTDSCHCRHDLWVAGAHSGRIVCRLTLETPTVVGANQEGDENTSKLVTPYRRDGQPAIPGSSLRGMVGSVLETLSQSALRVLEKKKYSVRKPAEKGLSAIGLLKTSEDAGRRFDLIPMKLPTLREQAGHFVVPRPWQKAFPIGNGPLRQTLGIPIECYEQKIDEKGEVYLAHKLDCLLDPQKLRAFRGNKDGFYYALPAVTAHTDLAETIPVRIHGLKKIGGKFLYGQVIADGKDTLLTETEWQALRKENPQKADQYIKGVLFVLGIEGRERQIPARKRYEWFLPLPPTKKASATASSAKKVHRVPVDDTVIARFESLAKERYDVTGGELPFTLAGYPKHSLQLAPGELVFFDVDERGEVCEISRSAIWRRAVPGDSYEFFRGVDREVGPNLLPWSEDRRDLSPAEALLGVVQEEKSNPSLSARNLASRLRFSEGLPPEGIIPQVEEQATTLKILSSPKPPSPAMYFHPRSEGDNRYIKKADLSPTSDIPNGRKVYLHHRRNDRRPWASEHPDDDPGQKLRCTPLKANQSFYFHIDFDNLDNAELTLVVRSLVPSPEFRHRLGLGKPLGLGTVRVDIEGLFLITRELRYGMGALEQPRYHRLWRPARVNGSALPKQTYSLELRRLSEPGVEDQIGFEPEQAFFWNPALIDVTTLDLVNTVGNSQKLEPTVPVHTPLCLGQDVEDETFHWFVENDRARKPDQLARNPHQTLSPVKPGECLPRLARNRMKT